MANSFTLYVSDPSLGKDRISIPVTQTETPPIFPSSHWETHRTKPDIVINTLPVSANHALLNQMSHTNSWSDVLVTSFMVGVIRENEAKFSLINPEEWTILDFVINGRGDRVSPLELLHIEEDATQNPPLPVNIRSAAIDRLSTFFVLLLIYRKTLAKNSGEAYGTAQSLRLNTIFKIPSVGLNEDHLLAFNGFIADDSLTESYKRVICAIDMFFYKFPKHQHSVVRTATLPSRYRGCTALTALNQIAGLVGVTVDILGSYILTKQVSVEMLRLGEEGQDAGNEYGYFPYQLDMGLTSKSAYSTNVNPTLTLWLHTIGCVYHFKRSINARMTGAIDIARTMMTASAVAMSLRGTGETISRFATSEQDRRELNRRQELLNQAYALQGEEEDDEDEDEDDDPQPRRNEGQAQEQPPPPNPAPRGDAQNPHQLSGHAELLMTIIGNIKHNGGLSDEQLNRLKECCDSISNPNTDSIGEHFKQVYGGRRINRR